MAILALLGLLVFSSSPASAVPGPLDDAHKTLGRIYTDYVRYENRHDRSMNYVRTNVKYPLLKESGDWARYRRGLLRYDNSKIKTASVTDRLAFWINTYNTLVMEGVMEESVLLAGSGGNSGSVRSSPDFFTRPRPLAGQELSLMDIERTLRSLRDPRAWLAVNQGAVGSPALPKQPYSPTNLDDQLEEAATNFLADPLKFRIERDENILVLSTVFQDHAQDFTDAAIEIPEPARSYPASQRAVVAFILPRIRSQDRAYIVERKPSITFEAPDWSLNQAQ